MVEQEPGFFKSVAGIFDPGGDPGAIHAAADVVRRTADQMTSGSDVLSTVEATLLDTWAKGNGRDAYETVTTKFQNDLNEYAGEMAKAAGVMDEQADAIAEARRQASNFVKMAIAALAIGAGLAIFSFGASAAAAAAEVAIIQASFWAMIRQVAAMLVTRGLLMAAVKAAILTVAKRMLIGMAASFAATVMVKEFQGQNIMDPANWSANDASNILLGGILTAGILQASKLVKISPFKAGAIGGGLGGGTVQFWLNGKPVTDLEAWKTVGMSVAISAGAGAALSGASNRLGPPATKLASKLGGSGKTAPYGPITQKTWVWQSFGPGKLGADGWIKTTTGIPSGAVFYFINLGGDKTTKPVVQAPSSPGAADVQVPRIEAPHPVGQIGGGTTTVQQRGDSLYAIAQRIYGDGNKWPLIANANNLTAPHTIYRGQVLKIPSIQVPAGTP